MESGTKKVEKFVSVKETSTINKLPQNRHLKSEVVRAFIFHGKVSWFHLSLQHLSQLSCRNRYLAPLVIGKEK